MPRDEFFDAYRWYEKRAQGPGEDFLRCVDACVEEIKLRPNYGRLVEGEIRRAKVRRFPYDLFYEVKDETLLIHYVFHRSLSAERWQKRLRER